MADEPGAYDRLMSLAGAAVAVSASRRRRHRLIALSLGALFAAAVPIAGVTLPLYVTETGSSDGRVSSGSETLVGVNGTGSLVVLLVPIMVVAAVSFLLTSTRWRAATPLAWALTTLFALANLAALLSIGIFILPVTIALVVACANSPCARPRSA